MDSSPVSPQYRHDTQTDSYPKGTRGFTHVNGKLTFAPAALRGLVEILIEWQRGLV